MAARMNNQYEERLGTERMLPLIFKMALPAVAAQFVNLLYNIVDRIYIGHIPEIGTNALAGVGVTTSIVILISSFSAIVGAGGAPLAAMALGQGDRVRAGKFLGNGFMLLILFTVLTSLVSYLFMEPILRFAGASAVTLPYAEDYLSVYLLGTLFVEISTGLNTFINSQGRPKHCHVFRLDWGLAEYRARSDFYFLVRYGRKRSGTGHYSFAGMQRLVGVGLSMFRPCLLAFAKMLPEI